MSTYYKSRRRKAEEAIRDTFVAWAGTALTVGTANIILGCSTTVHEATHIRIHCASQEPYEGGQTVPNLNYKVTGTITVSASADDNTRDEYSTLEGLVEGFVEQPKSDMLALLGSYAGTNVGFDLLWEPIDCVDGVNEDTRRFESIYTFETVVGHAPY